jgi:DNA repair exonuclease SbcCD ATPase subunit
LAEEMKVLMGQMDALMAVKESLESENASQKEHIESLRSSVTVGDTQDLENSIAEEKSNRERLEKEVQKLHEMEATYSNQIIEYESRCDNAESQVMQLQNLVDGLRKDCELQKSERDEMERTVASLKETILQLQQTSEKNSSSELAQLHEGRIALEKELQSVKMELQQEILRSQKAESALSAMSNAPKVEFKEEQINAMRSELEIVRDQLNAEKRRATQLEDFVNRNRDIARTSSTGGNKKMDDDEDMEAAALSGGSAFKPLVGLIRSLPHPLGNNAMLTSIAMKIDKAVVALDARPHFRALLLLYLLIVHILLLA